ncbi:YD repeat-containing protein [Candidatus Magnetobacterium bavaricum]|uniref:YD repeat-containing protein n=1 Tax=Candidatus Magnetobacterium bavaricum TaxID=29290 RepID=A0A0F3GQ22_9BACT|nr:YD repeat-containing protein [Candidatus Magnetobacterium bavaricum]
MKVSQNDIDEAIRLFSDLRENGLDWRMRTYAGHWIHRLNRYQSNELAMSKCGYQALAYLMQKTGSERDVQEVAEILSTTSKGQSIKDLTDIAYSYGLHLTAATISPSELEDVPLPAIMHINGGNKEASGHYWVLEKIENGTLNLFDPQEGRLYRQSKSEFIGQWSGYALMIGDKEGLPGVRLSRNQMEHVYGGCCGVPRAEDNLGCPDGACKGASGVGVGGSSHASPKWSVNMVSMNLYMTDTPIWYNSTIGPSVEISLTYNSQSANALNEPFGNKWQFNYGSYLVVDTAGVVTVFMPDGRRDVYSPKSGGGYNAPYHTYNTLSELSENNFVLTFPNDTKYVYGIPAGTNSLQPFLVEIRDAYGQKIQFNYDKDVHLTSITDAGGLLSVLSYDSSGLVTKVTDPFGRSAAFRYDDKRNLIGITDMGGYRASLSYDKNVYLTGLETGLGKSTFYIEPSDDDTSNGSNPYPVPGGRMWSDYRITVTNPTGGKEEFFYDGLNGSSWYVSPKHYTSYVDASNNNYKSAVKDTYSISKSTKGEISEVNFARLHSISLSYDSNGNLLSQRNSNTSMAYTYNNIGLVTSVTDGKGTVTNMSYAPNNVDLTKIKDGLGTVSLTYNNSHDVISIADRLNNTTAFTYNTYGQIISDTDALGGTTTYYYDGKNRLVKIIRDNKEIHEYTYDSMNRVKTHKDATGLVLTFDYNNLNDITRVTYPDALYVSLAYSEKFPRLVASITDKVGQTTSYVYNALGLPIRIINPDTGVTAIEYDANGKMTKLTDPNSNVTVYAYDDANRLVKKTYADGNNVSYSYTGNLVSAITNARNIKKSISYDYNANVSYLGYSDGTPTVRYDYDKYNRLTSMSDGSGTYTYSYDENSRLTGIDGAGDVLSFQYDALDELISLKSKSGRALTYAYDTLNRLTTIQGASGAYIYAYTDASPLIQSLTRPNGSVTSYKYDALRRLTEVSNDNSSDANINRYTYAYNQQGLISSINISNAFFVTDPAIESISYNYNTLNQLLSSTPPSKAFTYDDDGNMTRGYTPEGYVFAATYDAENRLKSIQYTDKNGDVYKTEYVYRGDGFLAGKKEYKNASKTGEVSYLRTGALVLNERNASNSVTREYTWGLNMGGGIGGLLNLKQGGSDYSYLYDGTGNVRALIDSSQSLSASYEYDAFGNIMSKNESLAQSIQFSTKDYDSKTGLVYYGYRFYSPSIGRWLTRDPLGIKGGGTNLYGFVGGNPVNLVDPDGRTTNGFVILGEMFIGGWIGGYYAVHSNTSNDALILFKAGVIGAAVGAVGGGVMAIMPKSTPVVLTIARSVILNANLNLIGDNINGVSQGKALYNCITGISTSLTGGMVNRAVGGVVGDVVGGVVQGEMQEKIDDTVKQGEPLHITITRPSHWDNP